MSESQVIGPVSGTAEEKKVPIVLKLPASVVGGSGKRPIIVDQSDIVGPIHEVSLFRKSGSSIDESEPGKVVLDADEVVESMDELVVVSLPQTVVDAPDLKRVVFYSSDIIGPVAQPSVHAFDELTTTEKGWLKTGEAARLLGVHENTVRHWANIGVLHPRVFDSGHRRFSRQEVEWLIEHAQGDWLATPPVTYEEAAEREAFRVKDQNAG